MTLTPNYSFDKSKRGHQDVDDDIGRIADNLDLIDAAIKAREDEIDAVEGGHSEGTSNFAGQGGVTITHNLNLASYGVTIVQTDGDPIGSVGEIWVTDVAVNSFVVRNSGSAITSFTWITHNTT